MLILVAVTITVALDTGLFDKAKEGAKGTEVEADRETLLGAITASVDTNNDLQIPNAETLQGNLPEGWSVTGTGPYTEISPSPRNNEFRVLKNGNIKEPLILPEGWTETEKLPEWNNDKITAVTDGPNTIPLPDGYQISDNPEENTIEKGVVIKDNKGNEFVWIPITEDFENSYNNSSYSEPTELTTKYYSSGATYDSQATLDYLYGEGYYDYPETAEEKAKVENSFAYKAHYAEMVESVNRYHGFYIGRYETTIDENNEIGSKYDKPVLTTDDKISQTNNKYCSWYGLYYTGRNSNVVGNNGYLQTNMIWGQQWDAMIEYFKSKSIDYSEWGKSSQGEVVNSGQSTNSSNKNDRIYNIYDLRTNGWDWTAEAYSTHHRAGRGGDSYNSYSASYRNAYDGDYITLIPTNNYNFVSSRLTLYIK